MPLQSETTIEAPASAELAGGTIRKLLPGEHGAFLDHLLRLDPLSRFTRFGAPVSDAAVRRHAASVRAGRVLVLGYFVEGVLRGAAELHVFRGRGPQPRAGEAAFSVERPWQGKGVGSALMRHLIVLARNRRVEELHIVFLASNGGMKRIAIRNEADLRFDADEVVGLVHAPGPTPFSWLREWLADLYGILGTAADHQARLLPGAPRGR
ncbi:GNAT family N-acetyltransferase [Ancylobacter terrae]|uniref:GNAT family N-acetyltransferase n=1 Tax=Ancylobacter sp. sgz301288 TaxID=3342077 RepID=UPI00385BBB91